MATRELQADQEGLDLQDATETAEMQEILERPEVRVRVDYQDLPDHKEAALDSKVWRSDLSVNAKTRKDQGQQSEDWEKEEMLSARRWDLQEKVAHPDVLDLVAHSAIVVSQENQDLEEKVDQLDLRGRQDHPGLLDLTVSMAIVDLQENPETQELKD